MWWPNAFYCLAILHTLAWWQPVVGQESCHKHMQAADLPSYNLTLLPCHQGDTATARTIKDAVEWDDLGTSTITRAGQNINVYTFSIDLTSLDCDPSTPATKENCGAGRWVLPVVPRFCSAGSLIRTHAVASISVPLGVKGGEQLI